MHEFRRILLWIMLGSLALAALGGVSIILTASDGELIGRMVGACVTTAVAAGLLLPLSSLTESERKRVPALAGMSLVIAEFVLVMALIWGDSSWYWFERMLQTIIFLGLTGLVAVAFLLAARHPDGRWTGRVVLACCAVVFGMLMAGVWGARAIGGWEYEERCYLSAATLAGTGLLGALALLGLRAGDRRYWRWLGVAAATVGTALALAGIWGGASGNAVVLWFFLAVAAVVAHGCLALVVRLTGKQVWVRRGTIAMGMLAAGLLVVLVYYGETDRYGRYGYHHDWFMEFLARGAGAAGIVTGCGTLALFVLARLNRKFEFGPLPVAGLTQITLICPRCELKQSLPLGDARCGRCDLQFFTRVGEPRCPKCGYLLYGLQSDQCPECGTILTAVRPAAPPAPAPPAADQPVPGPTDQPIHRSTDHPT